MKLIDRIKRWLTTRPGRLVVAGAFGFATLSVSAIALAQEHPAPPPPSASGPAFAGPGAGHNAPAGPGEHPVAPGAPEHAGGGEHGAEHGGGHHDPAPFNFADIARYSQEKERAAKGEHVTPVTPYAYLLVNALILFFIYYSAGKKPVSEGLAARRAEVAKELEEAAKIKKEAEQRLDEYSTKLDTLDAELARIKADLVKAGETDRDRIVKEAEEKAERMRRDAQFLLDQELKQLRIDLLTHTVDVATAAAQKVLESKVSQQDHDRLAEEFLKDLQAPASKQGGLS